MPVVEQSAGSSTWNSVGTAGYWSDNTGSGTPNYSASGFSSGLDNTGFLTISGFFDSFPPGMDATTAISKINIYFSGAQPTKSGDVFDDEIFVHVSGVQIGSNLALATQWEIWDGGAFTGRTRLYSLSGGGATTGADITNLGFMLSAQSPGGGGNAFAYNFGMTVFWAAETINPIPDWQIASFSPTGNSNWARVRMNPLLRM